MWIVAAVRYLLNTYAQINSSYVCISSTFPLLFPLHLPSVLPSPPPLYSPLPQLLAKHVLQVHLNALQTQEEEAVEGELSLALLKKYIAFCRR